MNAGYRQVFKTQQFCCSSGAFRTLDARWFGWTSRVLSSVLSGIVSDPVHSECLRRGWLRNTTVVRAGRRGFKPQDRTRRGAPLFLISKEGGPARRNRHWSHPKVCSTSSETQPCVVGLPDLMGKQTVAHLDPCQPRAIGQTVLSFRSVRSVLWALRHWCWNPI